MRLQEVYCICRSACGNWKDPVLTEHKQQNTGTPFYNLRNFDQIQAVLDMIAPIDSLRESVRAVYECIPSQGMKNPVAGSTGALYSFSTSERNTFVNELSTLHTKIETIEETLRTTYEEVLPGFDVKLPANMNLAEMGKYIRDLDIIFCQNPLFRIDDTTIQLSSVDRGSIWINIVIFGAAATILLERLVKLVDGVLIVRSHHLTNQEQLLHYKSLQLKTELLETITKDFEQVHEIEVSSLSAALAKEYDITDAEDCERINKSVQRLSNLYAKGLEIYQAITPGKATPVFPPITQQQLSDEQIKLLTSGDASDN